MKEKDKIQDLDYLYASARLRSLEKGLLNRERMERMCEAKTLEDAAKVLAECHYDNFMPSHLADVEKALAEQRNEVFALLSSLAPDERMIDVFKVKYDYHNVKTILKGEHGNEEHHFLLTPCGRIPISQLTEMMREDVTAGMPKLMRQAVAEARDILGRTGDPQLVDFILDKACFAEMLELAAATKSDFLLGYVRLQIDGVNLRSAIRSQRMGRGYDFLKLCLIPGGNIDSSRLLADITPDLLEALYHSTPLADAAVAAAAALRGETGLATVDLQCDDAYMTYLQGAKYIAFGEQPLIAYLAAKESEFTAVRTIMAGRFADLKPEMIRERLRKAYV